MRVCGGAWRIWLLASLASLSFAARAQGLSGVDDGGQHYYLPSSARRIITLSPNLTELVYAAGAGDKLVAVSAFSDYPEAARKLPLIGDSMRLDVERVLALKPDLVLAWQSGNGGSDVAHLRRLGIPVVAMEARQLEDVARHLLWIGALAGSADTAHRAAQGYLRALAQLRLRYQGTAPLRVFYEIWHRPLMTVGHTQLISRALAVCGARNVFDDLSGLSPSVSEEALLARAPQVIVVGASQGESAQRLAAWHADVFFGPRIAARQIALLNADADLLHRESPRLILGIQALCASLDTLRPAP